MKTGKELLKALVQKAITKVRLSLTTFRLNRQKSKLIYRLKIVSLVSSFFDI